MNQNILTGKVIVKGSRLSENNGVFKVKRAILGIYKENRRRPRYYLEIYLENHRGDDGAVAPCINNIPVYTLFEKPPKPEELTGKTISDSKENSVSWDAWLGTDASELIENKVRFLEYKRGKLLIEWRANLGWPTNSGSLKFKGWATVKIHNSKG